MNSKTWEQALEEAAQSSTGGIFITPRNDGETIQGVIVGDPHPQEKFWKGQGVRKRWLLNFLRKPDNFVGVLELSNRNFKTDGASLQKYAEVAIVTIKRIGAKGDMQATLSVTYERPLTDVEIAGLPTHKLHNLAEVGRTNANGEDRAVDESIGF